MVGKNLKKLRCAKKMSQEELSEILCVTRQAVSNWETERTEPDIETLTKLSEALDVPVEELIYGPGHDGKAAGEDGHALKKTKDIVVNNSGKGITFGAALAMVISYANWHSVGWAIVHGMLNWAYVVYYIIKY